MYNYQFRFIDFFIIIESNSHQISSVRLRCVVTLLREIYLIDLRPNSLTYLSCPSSWLLSRLALSLRFDCFHRILLSTSTLPGRSFRFGLFHRLLLFSLFSGRLRRFLDLDTLLTSRKSLILSRSASLLHSRWDAFRLLLHNFT